MTTAAPLTVWQTTLDAIRSGIEATGQVVETFDAASNVGTARLLVTETWNVRVSVSEEHVGVVAYHHEGGLTAVATNPTAAEISALVRLVTAEAGR